MRGLWTYFNESFTKYIVPDQVAQSEFHLHPLWRHQCNQFAFLPASTGSSSSSSKTQCYKIEPLFSLFSYGCWIYFWRKKSEVLTWQQERDKMCTEDADRNSCLIHSAIRHLLGKQDEFGAHVTTKYNSKKNRQHLLIPRRQRNWTKAQL